MLFTAVTKFLFSLTRQTKDKNASGTGKRFVRRELHSLINEFQPRFVTMAIEIDSNFELFQINW